MFLLFFLGLPPLRRSQVEAKASNRPMLLLRPNPHLSSVAAQARTRGSLPPFLSFFSLRLPSRSLPAPLPLFSTPPRRPRRLPHPAACDDVADQYDGFDEELRRLLVLLPLEMRRRAEAHPEVRRLVEIVMDLGRRPLARFPSGDFFLSDCPISSQELHHAASQVALSSISPRKNQEASGSWE